MCRASRVVSLLKSDDWLMYVGVAIQSMWQMHVL